jgi:hypothetical protein
MALELINSSHAYDNKWGPSGNFAGNVIFKRLDKNGRGFTFTLTVKDSHGPGGRINALNGRHICAACWHAHGRFFSALFDQAPNARVFSSWTKWITRDTPWQDERIGSNAYPVMLSESCEC